MTNEQAYKELNRVHAHWDRKDANHIVVWTPGNKSNDCHEVEKFLMQAGMHVVNQKFDRVCGKTCTVYKHK